MHRREFNLNISLGRRITFRDHGQPRYTEHISYTAVFPATRTPERTLLTGFSPNDAACNNCSQSEYSVRELEAGLLGGWVEGVCLLLSQLRCSSECSLPASGPHKRPERGLSTGGGQARRRNSQPGSHLSYRQRRRHRGFNSASAIYY